MAPIGPPPPHLSHLKVSHLILADSNQWNRDRIRRFLPDYEDIILKIPLSATHHNDSLTWLPVKFGQYSTKTGYALITLDEAAPSPAEFNWQRCVWRLRTQPKIHTFLWKALSGALPVGDQLLLRGVVTNANCVRCGMLESVEHVLFHCQFAKDVWDRIPIHGLHQSSFTSVRQFLKIAPRLVNLPPSGIGGAALYAWTCWNIWLARNQLIFTNREFSAAETIIKSITEARNWQEAQHALPQQRHPIPTHPIAPIPPFAGPVCYVDASWVKESCVCGMGFVFDTPPESSVREISKTKDNVPSALAAEAYAIIAAIQQALDLGFQELQLCSDAQVIVKLINERRSDNSIHNLLLDIRLLMSHFQSFSFVYISRELNTRADALAKLAVCNHSVT